MVRAPGRRDAPRSSVLEAEAIAEIVRACTPIIEVLATRSRRGRADLCGSCCLYHRFDPDAREEQPREEEEPDAAHLERFGDDPPHYCATCLFRKPEDVEARMVYYAERVRAGSEVHILLSHTEDIKRWNR